MKEDLELGLEVGKQSEGLPERHAITLSRRHARALPLTIALSQKCMSSLNTQV